MKKSKRKGRNESTAKFSNDEEKYERPITAHGYDADNDFPDETKTQSPLSKTKNGSKLHNHKKKKKKKEKRTMSTVLQLELRRIIKEKCDITIQQKENEIINIFKLNNHKINEIKDIKKKEKEFYKMFRKLGIKKGYLQIFWKEYKKIESRKTSRKKMDQKNKNKNTVQTHKHHDKSDYDEKEAMNIVEIIKVFTNHKLYTQNIKNLNQKEFDKHFEHLKVGDILLKSLKKEMDELHIQSEYKQESDDTKEDILISKDYVLLQQNIDEKHLELLYYDQIGQFQES